MERLTGSFEGPANGGNDAKDKSDDAAGREGVNRVDKAGTGQAIISRILFGLKPKAHTSRSKECQQSCRCNRQCGSRQIPVKTVEHVAEMANGKVTHEKEICARPCSRALLCAAEAYTTHSKTRHALFDTHCKSVYIGNLSLRL